MLRNNSKGLERCKTYVQGHIILHVTFDEKKSEIRFIKYVGALLKNYVFQPIVFGAENVLTAPNDVLSDIFTVLF